MELRVWVRPFSFEPGSRYEDMVMLEIDVDDEPETMILCTHSCREITG